MPGTLRTKRIELLKSTPKNQQYFRHHRVKDIQDLETVHWENLYFLNINTQVWRRIIHRKGSRGTPESLAGLTGEYLSLYEASL